MNEITTYNSAQLPDTIEDLTQFVLVGKATLQAYMLKLKAVDKLKVAQAIKEQTLHETQEIAEALVAAEQRIGELLLSLPTAQGKRTDLETSAHRGEEVKTKAEISAEMGYSKKNVEDYQQMAKHPEVVQKVIEDALANGEVVTKSSVMKEIRAYKERIKELESREPKVPSDYTDMKLKLKSAQIAAERAESDFAKVKKENASLRKEKEKLEARLGNDEKAENITRSALFFCAGVSNFIEKYGGYVWLTQELDNMSPSDRDGYIKAIDAVYAWASQMKSNIGE